MTSRFIFRIAIGFVFTAQAFAHRPYEVAEGSFKRSDGRTVSVIRKVGDGIIGSDPVFFQFRLADGTIITSTDESFDRFVVSSRPDSVEVYRFPSDWIPVARSVHHFDGYLLKNVTTPGKRLLSPLHHTGAFWSAYGVALVFIALFVAGWIATRAIPKRSWLKSLRVFFFICLCFAAGFVALLILFAFPVSPFILGFFIAIAVGLYFLSRKFIRRSRTS